MKGKKMLTLKAYSPQKTVDAGKSLGEILKPGDVVCLTGNLGAGKTAFTRGIARALGIKDHITSPTFTIVNEYEAGIPLYHFDVYRVSSSDDMFEIGFEEYLYGDGVTVIEWADMIKDILPEEYIKVNIDIDKKSPDGNGRIICIDFKGKRYQGYEESLQKKICNL